MLNSQEIWQENVYEPFPAQAPSGERLSFIQKLVPILLLLGTIYLMGSGETTYPTVFSLQAEAGAVLAGSTITIDAQGISRIFTDEVQQWKEEIERWSAEHDLDPNLTATVMQIESCGYQKALSPAGAMGLFQVMPYHFAAGEDAFYTETNSRRGLDYLRKSLEKFAGDVRLALAGYNGGITGAGRPESEWNDEMRRYVYWGVNIYEDAIRGRERSEYVDEWLNAGGESLCALARGVSR